MNDATFEEGADKPLRLRAETAADLPVLSALIQDAVLPTSEVKWQPKRMRFAALLNRFRWEDKTAAEARKRGYERTQSMLVVDGVLRVISNGVDPQDKDLVLSVLAIEFTAAEDGAGRLRLILAGDGELALDVECIDLTLTDVTRPYLAPTRRAPSHEV